MASLRRAHENELANLQHEVARRERALTERQEAVSAVELALHGKIQSLQQDLARSGATMAEHETAAQSARAEMAALRDQINRHEAAAAENLAEQQRAEEKGRASEAAISNLRDTLAQKESALNEREEYSAALEARLRRTTANCVTSWKSNDRLPSTRTRSLRACALRSLRSTSKNPSWSIPQRPGTEPTTGDAGSPGTRSAPAGRRTMNCEASRQTPRSSYKRRVRDHEAHFKSLEEQTTNEIIQLQNRLQERELAEQQGHLESSACIPQSPVWKSKSAIRNTREELTQQLGQAAESRQELGAPAGSSELNSRQRSGARTSNSKPLCTSRNTLSIHREERGNEITELRNRLHQEKNDAETLREEFDRLRVEHTGIEGEIARSEQLRRKVEQNGQQATILTKRSKPAYKRKNWN